MTRWVLRLFGRAQRPVAWTMFCLAPVVVAGVALDVVRTGDAKVATIIAALILWHDTFSAVAEVENELDSEGAADE